MATRRAAAKAAVTAADPRRRAKLGGAARGGARRSASTSPRRELRDAVVLERTGRTRAQWFAVLDAFDARAKGHTATAKHLMDDHAVPPWWAQAITVDYERGRGIRSYGEREDGFAVTVQRALAVSSPRVWDAFVDQREVSAWRTTDHRQRVRERGRWRDADGGRGVFLRAVAGRLLRFSWDDPRRAPGSVVEVEFVARGDDRSTVKVTHRRIRSAEEREDLRQHWSWALDSLKSWLETGVALPLDTWLATRG